MGRSDLQHARVSRRQFIAGLIAATGVTAAASSHSPLAAQDLGSATSDDLLDAIVDQQNPDLAADALIHVFARSGIVVFEAQGVAPIVPPAEPRSPLAFERWQILPFVNELAVGSSRAAAEYDAMFPAQTDAREVLPTVGDVLAGYYGGATTPGADFTRAYLDRFLTDNMNVTAADLPAPTAIVSLLGGEILAQLQRAVGINGKPAARFETQFSGAAATRVDTGVLASKAPITGTHYLQVTPLRSQVGTCGVAQAFINDVIARISSVLTAAEGVTDIPLVGEILGALVKGVKLGINVILKAVDALLAPVLGVLRSIGAALSVASLIVGTLSPWTVSLAFRPTRNRFGVDAEVVTGAMDVVSGGWDRIPLPEAVRECAAFAGIELPKPTSEDAPVHISVSQSMPLLVIDNPELRLDINGTASATYVTQNETSEQAKGDEVISVAWITSVVEREDLKKLRDDLFAILFRQLPDLVAQVVRPLVNATAADLTNKLIALTKVSAQQPLFIAHHQPKEDPEEPTTPENPDNGDGGCFPGKFLMADPAAAQRRYIPMPIDVTGENIWDFRADGTVEVTYNNVVYTVTIDPSAVFTFSFDGTQSGTYTADNGILTVDISVSNVVVDADMIALQGDMSDLGPMTGQRSGPYVCGNPVVWQLPFVDIGDVPYELIPID